MNEFEVSEYGIFTTAIQTTNSRKTSLESDCSAIETNINSLNDSDIFMGSTCDSIVSGWGIIKTNLDNAIRDLDKTVLTLRTMHIQKI